jgi:hypothetical protein
MLANQAALALLLGLSAKPALSTWYYCGFFMATPQFVLLACIARPPLPGRGKVQG